MSIAKIRSWKDFGGWCLDQAAHAAIALAVSGWLARTPREMAIAAAIVLTIREVEQGRETVEEWLDARKPLFDPWDAPTVGRLLRDLHLPHRIRDVAAGTALAVGAFWLYLAL